MKKWSLYLLCLFMSTMAWAQKNVVSGVVTDNTSKEKVYQATVQLLKSDSSFVKGALTELDGSFKLPPVNTGKYILKVTYVGYKPSFRNVQLTEKETLTSVGSIPLIPDAVMLKAAEVTAQLAKVEMKGDTFQFNAGAYRVPQGSVLEELVKKLPGAEVGEDGSIKVNGKEVKKIMMNGKDFFGSDTKVAMKNIPTDIVDKIKAYDKKSDYARMSGIDDGEEETVLDLTVKKNMNKGWFANLDLGAGTEDRYTSRAMVNHFNDTQRMTLMGNMNNVNDRGFGSGGRFRGGGGGGLVAQKSVGFDFNINNGKKDNESGRFEVGGNMRFNHNNTDRQTVTNSQMFLGNTNSFSNSRSSNKSKSSSFNTDYYLEWQPDSMTTFMFRPNFSYSENDNWSVSNSVTFNKDPYVRMTDPLNQYASFYEQLKGEGGAAWAADSLGLVNENMRQSMSDGSSYSLGGNLQFNRRLNTKGRNVNVSLDGGLGESKNHSYSLSDVHYFNGGRSDIYNNQYNNSPSKNRNYSARVSYSEPIIKGLVAQLSYQYQYRYTDSDRSMYALDSLYRAYGITYPLGQIPSADSLLMVLDHRNSQYATYEYNNHSIQTMLRFNNQNINASVGVGFEPQTTYMDYQKDLIDTTVTRHVFNVSPRVDFRYKFSKTSQLRLSYNGRASQPSMTNLLDVTNDADPLNVSYGNPGLKPSWNNNFRLFANGYNVEKQRGWMLHMGMNQTSNSISNAVLYDEKTGARYSQPQNIDGNWSSNLFTMFNTAIDTAKYFNFSTFTSLRYSNSVGYISTDADFSQAMQGQRPDFGACDKSTTKNFGVNERLEFNYRRGIFDVGIYGNIDYSHASNNKQENANLDTYNFAYGGNFNLNFENGLSFSTTIGENSRRGYDDASMNTNELLWNAQLSQTFLKNKAATLSLKWYDILRQQSSISRNISATQRTDTWNNSINSYVMLTFTYRLNLFGDKETRRQMGRGDFGGGRPGGDGFRGRPGGGFGGGRHF